MSQTRHHLAAALQANAPVLSIAAFFLVIVTAFTLASDVFLSEQNILNLLRQNAPLLIVAVAMTFVITTGGIDLSVGSMLALVNALAALTLQAGLPWPLVIVAMLVTGAVIGAANGWMTAYEGIPAFIVTLASLSILRGVALLLTRGYSVPIATGSAFTELGRGWILGVPLPAVLAVIVALVGWTALTQTRFGRYITGIGANAEAVRRAGVDVRRVATVAYVVSGTAAALAGLIIATRLGSGSSNAGVGFELDVIAAVVLGRTSLMGGRGTMLALQLHIGSMADPFRFGRAGIDGRRVDRDGP